MGRAVERLTLALILTSFCLPSVAANQKKASEEEKPAATFRSKTQLVLVPTVVTDKKGEPVTGLTKDDFQIFDQHRPQEIKLFEEVTTSGTTPGAVKAAATPHEFSNRVPAEAGSSDRPRRLTIIAFDLVNMPTLKQASAKKALLDFLAGSAASGEPTAIYSISRKGVAIISDFSTDPKVITAAVDKLKNGHATAMTGGLERGMHEGLESGGAVSPNMMSTAVAGASDGGKEAAILQALEQFQAELELNMSSQEHRFAADSTLDGMEQIAQACAAIPGRKSLVWVGGGFPFDVSPTDMRLDPNAAPTYAAGRSGADDMLPRYLRLWRELNDAQVAVYPIDVRGLINTDLVPPSVMNPNSRYQSSVRFQNQQTYDTDQALASATGGKPFYGSNDLKEGFELAAKDSSHYYLIGYYLKPDKTDKVQWHEISVKTPLKGIDVRARGGYFYQPNTADVQASRQHDLSTALFSPVDFTAIPLTIRWTQTRPAGKTELRHVGFEMILPADFAEIDETDNNHFVSDIVAQARHLDGSPVGGLLNRTMDAHLNEAQLKEVKEHGLTYANSLDLPPGSYIVRFVVRDGLNGHMGSVAAPLTVE